MNYQENCLILDLGNGDAGFVKYSAKILEHFSKESYICLQSKHRGIRPKSFLGRIFLVNAYTGKKDVLPKTLLVLPVWILFSFFLIVTKKVDRIYLPYFNHWNIFFIFLFKLFRLPIIYTSHDGKMHYGEKRNYTQFVLDLNILLSTDIIFLSESVRHECKDLLRNQRSHIIPHGIFSIDGIQELTEVRQIPRLLFIGRISRYKGVEMLIEAVQKLDSNLYEKLVIAGKSNYKIQIPGANDKIKLIDKWLTEDEIAEFINDSDIMIFPYLEATQSGALTLAICGLRPILHTRVGGMTEQVSPNEAVSVAPNANELFKGLSILISDTALRKRLVDSLKQKKELLSWSQIAKSVEALISVQHH